MPTVPFVAWQFSASARGHLVARFDVARGHYEVQSYGEPYDETASAIRLWGLLADTLTDALACRSSVLMHFVWSQTKSRPGIQQNAHR
jgi:hypothetical protein